MDEFEIEFRAKNRHSHIIEFRKPSVLSMRFPDGQKTKSKTKIAAGVQARVYLKPYVIDGEIPEEVCDLFFEDGAEALKVPYDQFQFVDEGPMPE